MMRVLGWVVALALVVLPVHAEDTPETPPAAGALHQEAYELAGLIDGLTPEIAEAALEMTFRNFGFVIWHEFAHLLINEYDLPVLGWEEDAADTLAVMMLLNTPGQEAYRTLYAAAFGWVLSAEEMTNLSFETFHDEHSLDVQRAYHAICMLVGAEPEVFAEIADNVSMPPQRREKCKFEYARARKSWDAVLAPILSDEPGGGEVEIGYMDQDPGVQSLVADVLKKEGLLEEARATLTDAFKLPRDIGVYTGTCGGPGAWFQPDEARVVMCYELAELFFRRFAKAGILEVNAREGGSQQ